MKFISVLTEQSPSLPDRLLSNCYDIDAAMTHASYAFGALGERKYFVVCFTAKSIQSENIEKYIHVVTPGGPIGCDSTSVKNNMIVTFRINIYHGISHSHL